MAKHCVALWKSGWVLDTETATGNREEKKREEKKGREEEKREEKKGREEEKRDEKKGREEKKREEK